MAIKEVTKKITFVPFDIKKGRVIDESPSPTMTLTKGVLRFNKSVISELNLKGKFVRFYYDRIKKVIGFQFKDEVSLGSLKGDGKWKMVNQSSENGCWTVSVKKLLSAEFGEKIAGKKYPPFPVQKYRVPSGMDKGEIFYFIEIVDEVTNEPKKTTAELEATEADIDKALEELVTV